MEEGERQFRGVVSVAIPLVLTVLNLTESLSVSRWAVTARKAGRGEAVAYIHAHPLAVVGNGNREEVQEEEAQKEEDGP